MPLSCGPLKFCGVGHYYGSELHKNTVSCKIHRQLQVSYSQPSNTRLNEKTADVKVYVLGNSICIIKTKTGKINAVKNQNLGTGQ